MQSDVFTWTQIHRLMKRFFKWGGISLLLLLIAAFIAVKIMSKPLPEGVEGPEAERLTDDVLAAINDSAMDSIPWLQWEFIGGHKYIWHQASNTAKISWGDYDVIMNLDEVDGKVYESGKLINGQDAKDAIQTAWSYWCNDSFWMMAPNKLRDPNTSRALVDVSDRYTNSKGLLVSYQGGGVTPGDSYLWIIGEDNIPTAYEMYVSILPIKGLCITWEDWKKLYNGAMLATKHETKIGGFSMSGVKAGTTWSDLGLRESPF